MKALLEQGRDVRCLVRKTSNTQHLNQLKVELFNGDILNKESLKNIAKDINFIYHLAGEIHSPKSSNHYRINFIGTKNLVEVFHQKNIERFVYLSSIAAVGPNHAKGILLNEQTLCRPINPYGKSKLEAEKLLAQYFERYEFPSVIVRAPIIYGPSEQSNIITKILSAIHRGRFIIVGNGRNVRSLCYIDNLIQGLISIERFSNSIGETYFFADEKVYTYNEIFQTVAQEMGIDLKKIHLPNLIGTICGIVFKSLSIMGLYSVPLYVVWNMVLDMACDIRKAKEELNYKPEINTKEGIQKTIRYYLNKNST